MDEVLGFVVPDIVLGLAAGLAPGPLLGLAVLALMEVTQADLFFGRGRDVPCLSFV